MTGKLQHDSANGAGCAEGVYEGCIGSDGFGGLDTLAHSENGITLSRALIRLEKSMSLKLALQRVKTEEDVKDAYIKALGLKAYNKGLVDIQTEEVWFEAKGVSTAPVLMFTQLLFYVRAARKAGEMIPPFLAVIDTEKAAIMETAKALPILDDKEIVWPKSGSQVDKRLAAQAAPYIETHFVVYRIDSHEKEFIQSVKSAIKAGEILRTQITPDNLRQVFDRWVEMIGSELNGVKDTDYALLFFADIMHDGKKTAMRDLPAKLLHDDDQPVFLLNGKDYKLASDRGYRNFWSIYHRPPAADYRHYLLERRDSLLPLDERSFKGAFYTPLHIVDKAYDQLSSVLGKNWQQNYIVWDMCCGVGNLEVKHSNYRNIFMSTLDQADIDVMKASQTCAGANIFQYDYLNDDITDFGEIDYSLTNKMPLELRMAIEDARNNVKGAKKILILMNPPYAEATNGGNSVADESGNSKEGVAKTKFAAAAMHQYGKARNELFMQFIARAYQEVPSSTLAIFSKLKYICTPTLFEFRKAWKARLLGGFAVHSKAFDGLKGDFPISFLIWDTAKEETISCADVSALDRYGFEIGRKTFLNYDGQKLLTDWVVRPKANDVEVVPLKNAIAPAQASKDLRGARWADGAIGFLNCAGNDLQNAVDKTMLFSSGYGSARGFFVTEENLWQAAVVFSVRRLIKPTWLNDRDQFLQPSQPLTDDFKTDCLIWMLFNGSNLSAGADGLQWNGRSWSLVNHFIPFSEQEVATSGRFESDFMRRYLSGLKLTAESLSVLNEGRNLWRRYHSMQFGRTIREEFGLNRPDVGWYQIRRALEANNENEFTDFDPFKKSYSILTEKLRPQVFEFGFLLD